MGSPRETGNMVFSSDTGDAVVKNPPANAGDSRYAGLTPRLGRSPGGGNEILLQYCCLENPMDRGASWVQFTGSQSGMTEES